MHTEIDLANIAVLDHSLITSVGSVMGGAVVQRASSRETNARLESVSLDQVASSVLDHFHNLNHGHARLDVAASILADLAMDFRCPANVVVLIKVLSFQCSLLLVSGSPEVPVEKWSREKKLTWLV